MADITALERAALSEIRMESAEWAEVIDHILLTSGVVSRVNTGGGFFTELKAVSGAMWMDGTKRISQKGVWICVAGIEYGLGIILHLQKEMALLEGYAVGPEDTSIIDFERSLFAVAEQPGPFQGGTASHP